MEAEILLTQGEQNLPPGALSDFLFLKHDTFELGLCGKIGLPGLFTF